MRRRRRRRNPSTGTIALIGAAAYLGIGLAFWAKSGFRTDRHAPALTVLWPLQFVGTSLPVGG